MKKLRGICIGAGYFSHYQFEAWSRLPEVAIIAVVNRTLDRAREVATKFGLPRACGWEGLPALLDHERPDFVDIITPPGTHLELVLMAASRGIAVICQKPLAPTWEEAVAIVAPARRAGVRFMVHETGVHFLDVFRYLGGEVATVYARLQKRNPAIAGEDAGQIVCGFASGATAILDASRYSEVVNGGTTRLTHLDLGNTHLQLVEPLTPGHPLHAWIARNGGAGLHHFCLRVADVGESQTALVADGLPTAPAPHQGTQGKRALFLDKTSTQGVQVEITGR